MGVIMKDIITKNLLLLYAKIKPLMSKYKFVIKSILLWQIIITLITFTKLNLFLVILLFLILLFTS